MSKRNIVHHVTRQYMKKNKRRTFTTFLGIVFMVMLMTCVFVGKDTGVAYLGDIAAANDGKWHAIVYQADKGAYEEIKDIRQVKETSVSADYGCTDFTQSANPDRPYLQVKAYGTKNFDWMNIELTEGRLPEKPGEIILNKDVLTDGGKVAIGDTISASYFKRMIQRYDTEGTTLFPFDRFTLEGNEAKEAPQGFPYYGENDTFFETKVATGETATYTVVGFMECPDFEKSGAGAYTALTFLDEKTALPECFNVSVVLNVRHAGSALDRLEDIAGDWTKLESNNSVLALSGNSSDNTINIAVTALSVFFIVLIMAASVVLVYNVFNMSFDERSKYLGMLSSIGATGKQKRSSVYYEAYSLLLPALPTGFFVGLFVVKAGMMALKPHIDQMLSMEYIARLSTVRLDVSVGGVIATILLCVITVAISAFLPARKISKVGPIECIRGNVEQKRKTYRMNRFAIKRFGAEGMLAGNFVKREKKKTRGFIGAITVFMVILIVVSFGTETITEMVDSLLEGNNTMAYCADFDYEVASGYYDEDGAIYETFWSGVAEQPDVERAVEWGYSMGVGTMSTEVYSQEYWTAYRTILDEYGITDAEYEELRRESDQTVVSMLAVDEETMAKLVKRANAEDTYDLNAECPPVLLVKEGELTTYRIRHGDGVRANYKICEVQNMTNLQKGEVENLTLFRWDEEGEYTGIEYPVTVAGFVDEEMLKDVVEFHSENLWLIVGPETAEKMGVAVEGEGRNPMLHWSGMIKLRRPDGEFGTYLLEQSRRTEPRELYVFRNESVSIGDMKSAINAAIRILLICFVVLTSVICMLNLYNSVRGRISGKRKEFAILRSVGMTERQMYKMLCMEAGGILFRSVGIAVLVSTPLILFVDRMILSLWGKVGVGFPWGVYALAIVLAAAAVFGMTLFSYRMEKKENILVDIRSESV
ncbi:MAG: ABC transporter permease [Lachnospiraceae bacterium]|nr:ABC transporter permease [Lachnospiraceae bacterium]